jgi:hypothetical protein
MPDVRPLSRQHALPLRRVIVIPQSRAVPLLATGFAYLALSVLFALASTAAHPVSLAADRLAGSLPMLTQLFALPVLGVGPLGHRGIPGPGHYRSAIYYLFWSGLFLGPGLVLLLTLSAREHSSALARWVYGWSLYLPLAATAVGTVLLSSLLLFS